ncbi:hypothetical protein NZA98_18455, partial [Escherichia coli]|nr:hypothetical protein [Escherichia coli]
MLKKLLLITTIAGGAMLGGVSVSSAAERPVVIDGDFFVTAGQSVDIDVASLVTGAFATADFSMLPPSRGTLSSISGSRVRYTASADARGNDQFGFFVATAAPDFLTASGTIRISIQPS